MSPDKKKKLYILRKKLDNLDNKLIRLIKLRTKKIDKLLRLESNTPSTRCSKEKEDNSSI